MSTPQERLNVLARNREITPIPQSAENMIRECAIAVHSDGRLFLSGYGPIDDNGVRYEGIIGVDVQLDEACAAAEMTAINLLLRAARAVGSVNEVASVLAVSCFVRAHDQFEQHSDVADAFSRVLHRVLSDSADGFTPHARTAIGVTSLPLGMCFEASMELRLRSADSFQW